MMLPYIRILYSGVSKFWGILSGKGDIYKFIRENSFSLKNTIILPGHFLNYIPNIGGFS